MTPVEHDVYLCCRHPGDSGMAADVAAGLTQSGFRVVVAGTDPEGADDARRRTAIEAAPDFVLLSCPASGLPAGTGPDPRRADFAHALKTRRNIVVLADPAHADPLASAEMPGYPSLAPWQRVAYDRGRPRESIALVGHRLLSSSEVEDRRLMRGAKRAFMAVAVLLALAVASRAVPAALKYWNRPQPPPPVPRFTVYWTAVGQRLQNGTWSGFPVTDGGAVTGGDRVRLVFSPGSDGFAYVVLRDTRGGIALAYPGATVRGASRVKAGQVYQAPGSGQWVSVDPQAGLATIYLIAGHEPLENLEELVEEPDADASPEARLDLLQSTLTGLLDGKRAAVRRPVRIRSGREVVDRLQPVPPPAGWSSTLADGSVVPHRPATQTGLVSVVVEIRLRPGPP